MATKNFTLFSTATPLTTSDYVVGYNAAGTAEIKTQVKDIVNLVQDSDAQALSFNNNTKNLSISNGNTVSLSALVDTLVGSYSSFIGPVVLNRFRAIIFQNSGYNPVNPPAGMFQFIPPGNTVEGSDPVSARLINPYQVFGPNATYTITTYVRATNVIFDGLHCQLRSHDGTTETIIPGLEDFGSGAGIDTRTYFATSLPLTATTNTFFGYIPYFGAYNGGNGGTVQDVVLTFQRV